MTNYTQTNSFPVAELTALFRGLPLGIQEVPSYKSVTPHVRPVLSQALDAFVANKDSLPWMVSVDGEEWRVTSKEASEDGPADSNHLILRPVNPEGIDPSVRKAWRQSEVQFVLVGGGDYLIHSVDTVLKHPLCPNLLLRQQIAPYGALNHPRTKIRNEIEMRADAVNLGLAPDADLGPYVTELAERIAQRIEAAGYHFASRPGDPNGSTLIPSLAGQDLGFATILFSITPAEAGVKPALLSIRARVEDKVARMLLPSPLAKIWQSLSWFTKA